MVFNTLTLTQQTLSLHFYLYLLILFKVEVGWSLSQNALKQWNTLDRWLVHHQHRQTNTATPTFTPVSSFEFPIHLTHISAPRGNPQERRENMQRPQRKAPLRLRSTQEVFCCKSTVHFFCKYHQCQHPSVNNKWAFRVILKALSIYTTLAKYYILQQFVHNMDGNHHLGLFD